jgi:hypothetical protein
MSNYWGFGKQLSDRENRGRSMQMKLESGKKVRNEAKRGYGKKKRN